MATVSKTQLQTALLAKGDDVEAGVLRGTNINVEAETPEQPALAPGNLYGLCNFHIRNSRDYVGDHRLTTYIYFYYMEYTYVLIILISLALSPFVGVPAAVPCILLNIPFLPFFIQHMYVNIKTMRYVLKQPEVPDHQMKYSSAFLEISLEEYAVAYATTKEAGFGIVYKEKGTVKIQVLQQATKRKMKACVCISTLEFLSVIPVIIYCIVWAGVGGQY